MPDYNSPILADALRRVQKEPLYYRPRFLWLRSRSAWDEAYAYTVRVRLANLIAAAIKHWPCYKTVSCCKWYLRELESIRERVSGDDDIITDIGQYRTFLSQLMAEFEQSYGIVDPGVFGWLLANLGETGGLPANLSFLIGPTTYAWTGISFACGRRPGDPFYELGEFANSYL
jgi:hypothetical protein